VRGLKKETEQRARLRTIRTEKARRRQGKEGQGGRGGQATRKRREEQEDNLLLQLTKPLPSPIAVYWKRMTRDKTKKGGGRGQGKSG
jgi:hypothetical protein